MPVSVISLIPNPSIPFSLAGDRPRILSGIVECVFKGNAVGIARDKIRFAVGRVNLSGGAPLEASCLVSLASFAYDGVVNDALWAVDGARITRQVNEDRGSGTADLEVEADLAVRGLNGVILRLNYIVISAR
jgi:hypothetical protein